MRISYLIGKVEDRRWLNTSLQTGSPT